jgi:ABC-type phosphate transport system substrate-binding protein
LQDTDYDYFPLFAAPIVAVYNIPLLRYEDDSITDKPILSLSRDVLADIYRYKILFWDDDRIQQDNHNVN